MFFQGGGKEEISLQRDVFMAIWSESSSLVKKTE